MAEIIKMPKLSDTMTDGVVAKWHKKIGDKVKSGELLADIETDKATMEFESYFDGTLLFIGVENGKAAPVDSILAIIGKAGEDISALTKSNGAAVKEVAAEPVKENKTVAANTNTSAPQIPSTVNIIRMPKLSDTMTEGVVAKWHKKKGDKVKSGELLADIETDKATMEFESYFDGVILYTGVEQGKGAPVDSILAIIGKGTEDVTAIVDFEKQNGGVKTADIKTEAPKQEVSVATPQPVKEETPVFSNASGRVIASPLAKKIAKEKGVDLNAVRGTGDFGRIVKKDVESYTPGQKSGGSFAATPFIAGKESFKEEAVSQMRRVIAKRLTDSKNSAPHFYLTIDVNMENAIAARTAINEAGSVKTSYNDLVVKACAYSLRRHPKVNSAWMGDKIRFNDHIHIGIAVAIEDGLLVPVVRFADQKSLPQIATEIKDLGKKAKERKLQPADWEGNTFTVSNLGMFGIEEFTSIINSPEACILAVGAIRNIPVVKNGMVVPGNMMKMTLSCDHRVVDGATGAAFLQTLKQTIENPVVMFV